MKRRAGVAALALVLSSTAAATWKPEYAIEPKAVQDWFRQAKPTPEASARFGGISSCCERAERLVTKFVAAPGGEWSYYTNPNCTHKGCALAPIPNDVVQQKTLHAINPKDDKLPQFDDMRREGVLFIWRGQPTCFWPPQSGI